MVYGFDEEKEPWGNSDDVPGDHSEDMPSTRLRRFFLLAGILSVAFWFFLGQSADSATVGTEPVTQAGNTGISSTNGTLTKVPLEAHIMSRCPDARDCLQDLIVPAMENISDKVLFNLSFIGSFDNNENVVCKHGPSECIGNMLSLCAKYLFPNDTIISLGFSNCLIDSYSRIADRELVESCALEHGISFEALNNCVSEDGKGIELLTDSIQRSQAAGIERSCTIRVDGKQWCVRDGARWKNCDQGHKPKDLIAEIERLYKGA